MRLLHSASRTHASFDDLNLVSCAGLVPVMGLAQGCGLDAQLVQIGTSGGYNPAGKITSIVAGLVASADCIDDLDVIRHGGVGALFGGTTAVHAGLVFTGVHLRARVWTVPDLVDTRL